MSQDPDRRHTSERRKNNRRTTDGISPPYFEVFERIANALEHIELLLTQRAVVLPDSERDPVNPR